MKNLTKHINYFLYICIIILVFFILNNVITSRKGLNNDLFDTVIKEESFDADGRLIHVSQTYTFATGKVEIKNFTYVHENRRRIEVNDDTREAKVYERRKLVDGKLVYDPMGRLTCVAAGLYENGTFVQKRAATAWTIDKEGNIVPYKYDWRQGSGFFIGSIKNVLSATKKVWVDFKEQLGDLRKKAW